MVKVEEHFYVRGDGHVRGGVNDLRLRGLRPAQCRYACCARGQGIQVELVLNGFGKINRATRLRRACHESSCEMLRRRREIIRPLWITSQAAVLRLEPKIGFL